MWCFLYGRYLKIERRRQIDSTWLTYVYWMKNSYKNKTIQTINKYRYNKKTVCTTYVLQHISKFHVVFSVKMSFFFCYIYWITIISVYFNITSCRLIRCILLFLAFFKKNWISGSILNIYDLNQMYQSQLINKTMVLLLTHIAFMGPFMGPINRRLNT